MPTPTSDILASFDADALVPDVLLAPALGTKQKTLQNWRSAGSGPPFYRVGGRCLYRVGDVRDWLCARRVTPGRRVA